MAGGILQRLVLEIGRNIEVKTAGFSPGSSLAPHAVEVMQEIGIDISSDAPKRITEDLVEWADMIIPVCAGYGGELVDFFAEDRIEEKIRYLSRDIPDPFDGDRQCYRDCRDFLYEEIRKLLLDL
ncbi:MAG: hypothetical protein HY689_00995 [Chloroflexi bacterium]|nr:hypothetical protein [Chloroflexota bacterium]